MKTFEERFTAYVDGLLEGRDLAEFEKELAAHPDAATDREEALRLRRLLRAHPAAPVLTNPDFFNLQIQQRIAAEQPRARVREPRASFWSAPRLAWAGGFCLLLAVILYQTLIPSRGPAPGSSDSLYFAQVVESWPSDPSIYANTVYNPEDNLTVLWLDGLDYLPASYALK